VSEIKYITRQERKSTEENPERFGHVLMCIYGGLSTRDAVLYSGIPKETLYGWLRMGRAVREVPDDMLTAREVKLKHFSLEFDRALVSPKARCTQALIAAATAGDWRAAATFLKLRYPAEFSGVAQTEPDEDEPQQDIDYSSLTDDEKVTLRELLDKAINRG
jgi:hypothetical protein